MEKLKYLKLALLNLASLKNDHPVPPYTSSF